MDKIFYLSNLAKEDSKRFTKQRFVANTLNSLIKKDRFIGIVGPRGVGKTVLLKQLLNKKNAVYISLDTTSKEDIFNKIVNINKQYKIDLFLLDEIHFHGNFSSLLKQLYDFTNIRVVLTTSVSLIFSQLEKDLSRRVRILNLYPFDFREYLFFNQNLNFAALSFEDIAKSKCTSDYMGKETDFENYLKGDIYPFSIEASNVIENLKNIKKTILYKDIPSVYDFSLKEIQIIDNMIFFVGKSAIDGISYSSISHNLNITKYKAKQYVEILERTFILNRVIAKGTNVLKEPKIVISLPFRLLYSSYNNSIGALREDFAVESLKMKNYSFYYLKSKKGEKRPDYLLKTEKENFIIEIGGKGKGYKQFKGIDTGKYKKLIFAQNADISKNQIPLYMLGFLRQYTNNEKV